VAKRIKVKITATDVYPDCRTYTRGTLDQDLKATSWPHTMFSIAALRKKGREIQHE
jgi:hypothetical protein